MVDERRVRRLLQRISEDLTFLEARVDGRHELVGDTERLAAVKYVFVTAIEGCIDVAQHVAASEGWGPPTTNADAIRLLGRHRVLDPPLAEAVARSVGFRNVLVHGYVDVDDARVVAFLDRLDDLRRFVAGVAAMVEGQSAP